MRGDAAGMFRARPSIANPAGRLFGADPWEPAVGGRFTTTRRHVDDSLGDRMQLVEPFESHGDSSVGGPGSASCSTDPSGPQGDAMVQPALESLNEPLLRRLLRELGDEATAFRFEVAPNPCVGAAILSRGELVAKGFHRVWGGPHAERDALANAAQTDVPRNEWDTLVVTLEPCCSTARPGRACKRSSTRGSARSSSASATPTLVTAARASTSCAPGRQRPPARRLRAARRRRAALPELEPARPLPPAASVVDREVGADAHGSTVAAGRRRRRSLDHLVGVAERSASLARSRRRDPDRRGQRCSPTTRA